MFALDTNLLVRLVTNDDPVQARKVAKRLDSEESFFVPLTVALELEWVLRGAYLLDTASIINGFKALLAIRNVYFESDASVTASLEHYANGSDFADAIHLVSAQRCASLLTFDKKFVNLAKRLSLTPKVEGL